MKGRQNAKRHHDSSCIEGLLIPPHTNSQRGGDEEGGPGVIGWNTVPVALQHPPRWVRTFDHPWGLCDCLPIPSSLQNTPTGGFLHPIQNQEKRFLAPRSRGGGPLPPSGSGPACAPVPIGAAPWPSVRGGHRPPVWRPPRPPLGRGRHRVPPSGGGVRVFPRPGAGPGAPPGLPRVSRRPEEDPRAPPSD